MANLPSPIVEIISTNKYKIFIKYYFCRCQDFLLKAQLIHKKNMYLTNVNILSNESYGSKHFQKVILVCFLLLRISIIFYVFIFYLTIDITHAILKCL